jgi:molecular chaperone HscA
VEQQDYRDIVDALFDRLEADARLLQPQFTAVVSALERKALAVILGRETKTKEVGQALNIEEQPSSLPSSEIPEPPPISLDLSCLDAHPAPGYVVCIDFGTAKSKAFAARVSADGDNDDLYDGFELGLGKMDHDLDGAVYSVASSIWISDEGRMFAGSQALTLSARYALSTGRERLDSIKQQLSQTDHRDSLNHILDESINPTGITLTHRDAMCFFLAYLTDLIGQELEAEHRLSRYTPRRFTIPAWSDAQRSWANAELRKLVVRAQVLADTFRGRWSEGIPVEDVKEAIRIASQHDTDLMKLLDPEVVKAEFGISEPMAAGSGRIRIDRSTRNLVLIIDVGAGTTDFGLFLVNYDKRTAFPVEPKSAAIRMAGDHIDNLLVEFIISKAAGHPDRLTKERINLNLRRGGIRRDKERLFTTGRLDVTLATDQPVTVTLEEFLASPGVREFAEHIERQLVRFLSQVDNSFEKATVLPTMLLTGGGANIPFIQKLPTKRWRIGERDFSFKLAKQVPEAIGEYDSDFQREYHQLAVAMGGSMQIMDEKSALPIFAGGFVPLGPLTRYPVTGM